MSDNSNDLKILSRSLKAISKINRDLLSFNSEKKLCQAICNDLVQIKGYKFVWMGLKESDDNNITPVALQGKDKDFIKSVKGSWDKYSFNGCPTSMALKRGKQFKNKDLKDVQRFVPWDKKAIEEGFLSALILPIRYNSDVIGTLHVYSDTKNYFLKEERSFLKEVAGDIGLGIKSIRDDRKFIKSKIEYKELVKRISSCVSIYEVTGNGNDFIFKDFNKAAEKADKIKKEDIIGKSVLKVFPGVKEYGLFDVFKRVYKTGKPESHPISIYKDKRIYGWRENFVYKLANGNVVAVYNDLTEKKKAEEELILANERLVLAQKSAGAGIWDWDINTEKLNWSPELYILFGLDPAKHITTFDTWRKVLHPEDRQMAEERLNESIKKRKPLFQEFRIIMPSGKARWINALGNTTYDEHGKAVRVTGICINITERKKYEEEILHLSFHDQLTELYNRRFFEEELKRLDTKRQLPLSLIICDLNGLKLINDVFGHAEGDELLKETAEILKKVCRFDDILARWGGDEFVLLLPKTSVAESEDIVQRIKKECKKTNNQKIPVSLSLGAAAKETTAQDIQMVIIDAESNMYKNKLIEKESLTSSIIFALDQALFEKSSETKEHTDKIREIALKLGKSIKLPSNQLDELSLLASLHDIGKVAIPETILLKEGKLTEKEWSVIKRHPEIGFNIANASPQIAHIAKSILSCHENWDGSGYPLGIKGEAIPVISRIILIADTYDVMTSGRIYKKVMSKDAAIKELRRCAGTQFDTVLVDKFIEIMSD